MDFGRQVDSLLFDVGPLRVSLELAGVFLSVGTCGIRIVAVGLPWGTRHFALVRSRHGDLQLVSIV